MVTAEQTFQEGYSGVRLIGTAVNRSLDGWTRPFMHRGAYAGLLEARTRFGSGNYEMAGWVAASRVLGSAAALELTQRGAVHYYQQPDDDAVLDPARTSLAGTWPSTR